MNYALAYARLMHRAKLRVCIAGYVERHHVLPKALGGSDDSSNLVTLTAREHFIAHMLLARMYGGSMWHAVAFMTRDGRGSSRSVAEARKKLSETMLGNKKTLGRKASDDERARMSKARKGKPGRQHSPETKALLSSLNKGKVIPEDVKQKLSLAQKGKPKPEGFGARVAASLKGRPRSQETKDKLSAHYRALREAKKAIESAATMSNSTLKETQP